MNEETTILVLGLDELGSAVARKLHLAGYAVALHQSGAPRTIRRRMAFADAWIEGTCAFEGVEARRADKRKDVVAALRTGAFIPVLTHPLEDVTARWRWDIVVDARTPAVPDKLRPYADFTIGLGRGFAAGDHCDVAIDTGSRDPGAVWRRGAIPLAELGGGARFADGAMIAAPCHGVFTSALEFGEPVAKGAIIGCIGATEVRATASGRIRGLARTGAAVARGTEIAEVVAPEHAEFSGIARRDKLIARSVAFVIEMERAGHAPITLENLL